MKAITKPARQSPSRNHKETWRCLRDITDRPRSRACDETWLRVTRKHSHGAVHTLSVYTDVVEGGPLRCIGV